MSLDKMSLKCLCAVSVVVFECHSTDGLFIFNFRQVAHIKKFTLCRFRFFINYITLFHYEIFPGPTTGFVFTRSHVETTLSWVTWANCTLVLVQVTPCAQPAQNLITMSSKSTRQTNLTRGSIVRGPRLWRVIFCGRPVCRQTGRNSNSERGFKSSFLLDLAVFWLKYGFSSQARFWAENGPR